jgi:hypothetical protein
MCILTPQLALDPDNLGDLVDFKGSVIRMCRVIRVIRFNLWDRLEQPVVVVF